MPARSYYRKKPTVEVPEGYIGMNSNPLLDFIQIYNIFFGEYSYNSNKYKKMLERRVTDAETLDAIAKDYGLTRERVRQIVEMLNDKFNALFSGDSIKTPRIKLRMEFVSRFQKIKRHLSTSFAHISEDIVTYINANYSSPITGNEDPNFFNLFMFFMGFELYEVDGKEVFFDRSVVHSVGIIDSYMKSIKQALMQNIMPMSVVDIAKKTKIDSDYVRALAPIFDFIEPVGSPYKTPYQQEYQLKASYFINSLDAMYRYLKNKGEPATLEEIQQQAGGTLISIGPRLNIDKRFKAVGKKSTYGLSGWDIDTRNYLELMEDTLREIGKPVSAKKLHHELIKINSDFPYNTINSYAQMYSDKFKKTEDNKVTLTEWSGYKAKPLDNRRTYVRSYEFSKYAVSFLSKKPGKQCSSSSFYEYMRSVCPGTPGQVLYNKVYYSPILNYIVERSNKQKARVSLKDNYREIMSELSRKKKSKEAKSMSNIEASAIRYLSSEGPMKMNKLVKILKGLGATPPTIYQVLDRGPFVKKSLPNTNRKIIELEAA